LGVPARSGDEQIDEAGEDGVEGAEVGGRDGDEEQRHGGGLDEGIAIRPLHLWSSRQTDWKNEITGPRWRSGAAGFAERRSICAFAR
jgi:hypothetical protein